MRFLEIEQNTEEWRRQRMGRPTASNFHLILTPLGKLVDSRERKSYMYRLVAERILGEPMPSRFEGNDDTERGIELEPRAAAALEARLGSQLGPGGMVFSDDGRIACSPDRIHRRWAISQPEGMARAVPESVEIKCPAPWTHIGYMIDGPGEKYKPQVQGQILIGGFSRCHFWSYHPRFAPVHVVTEPDEAYLRKMSNALDLFCDQLDQTESWVRRHGNVAEIVKEAMEI